MSVYPKISYDEKAEENNKNRFTNKHNMMKLSTRTLAHNYSHTEIVRGVQMVPILVYQMK